MNSRKESTNRVRIDDCIARRLYRIRSRSLGPLAVYNGNEGFIGLRCKFTSVFLSTEFHWDQGPPFGTVFGVEDTGIDLPENIGLCESPGDIDEATGRWVEFDPPSMDGGRGWYFTDTGEASADIRPVVKHNDALFGWLWDHGANEKHWNRPERV